MVYNWPLSRHPDDGRYDWQGWPAERPLPDEGPERTGSHRGCVKTRGHREVVDQTSPQQPEISGATGWWQQEAPEADVTRLRETNFLRQLIVFEF